MKVRKRKLICYKKSFGMAKVGNFVEIHYCNGNIARTNRFSSAIANLFMFT